MFEAKHVGYRINESLSGLARELYLASWAYMHTAFGDNVEFERLAEQVLYCPQTRQALYKKPAVNVPYERGFRPVLEDVVARVCAGAENDREKVLALFCYVRDLYLKYNGEDFFYGGTEEELIKKGEWYCERVSRLMVALCQIAGFWGRIIFHIAAGHVCVEIFVDDRWSYLDPRFGILYVDNNDNLLSVDQLLQNPEFLADQPDWVKTYRSSYWPDESRSNFSRFRCFHRREIQCFGPYSLNDAARYHFDWRSCQIAQQESRQITRIYQELRELFFSL